VKPNTCILFRFSKCGFGIYTDFSIKLENITDLYLEVLAILLGLTMN